MKQYRLKPEAVPFFLEKLATSVHPYHHWEEIGVDHKALEEVKDAFITYGHGDRKNYASLGGWSKDDGAHFHFTINFPSVKMGEHDKFSNGKVIRCLMDRIQTSVNLFYSDFLNSEEAAKI